MSIRAMSYKDLPFSRNKMKNLNTPCQSNNAVVGTKLLIPTKNSRFKYYVDSLWQLMKNFRISLILLLLTSSVFFTLGAVPENLYFNKEVISNGEIWRLISAHVIHSDLQHLLWNISALIILSLLIERESRFLLIASLLTGIVSINYYLWINAIGVINYAGFSGVLNTLLVIALFQQWQKQSSSLVMHYLPVIIYTVNLLKIMFELFYQQSIFTDISWQAVPQVHLTGFIAGTILVLLMQFFQFISARISPVMKVL